MSVVFKRVAAFMMLVMLMISMAMAEESPVNTYTLTEENDRVKTKRDNGFIEAEDIDQKDKHFGWGLGTFYIQGYSDVILEADGTPVFLKNEGDQIVFGFHLTQDINALNGDSGIRIYEDTDGFDTAFAVKKTNFGKGCLIIRKSDENGHAKEPTVIPDYLEKVAANATETTVGPLTEGIYKGQLDYEIQYDKKLGFHGYDDYKIPFSFKIRTEEAFHETAAAAAVGNSNGNQSGTAAVTAGGESNGNQAGTAAVTVAGDSNGNQAGTTAVTAGGKTNGNTAPTETKAAAADANRIQNGAIIVAICAVVIFALGAMAVIIKERKTSSGNSDQENPSALPDGGQQKKEPKLSRKILVIVILLTAALLCIFVLRPILSSKDTYAGSIAFLEERLANTNKLILGSGSASFIMSMFPEDTGTPIANELAKLSSHLLLITSSILLERYLITAIGLAACIIIFPAACLFGIAAVAATRKENRRKLAEHAIRMCVFGICFILIIPLGCACGQTIEELNRDSINRAMAIAEEANSIVEQIPETEEKNIFGKVKDFFSDIWSSATQAYDWGKSVLSNYMSSVSVMLVTTIAIPIMILLAFIWAIIFLTRKDFARMLLGTPEEDANKAPGREVGC